MEKGMEPRADLRPSAHQSCPPPPVCCFTTHTSGEGGRGNSPHAVKGAHPSGLTRDTDVGQHSLLAILDTADLWEVHVQRQVEQAGEEGQHAHGHAVAAGTGVPVVDAELLLLRRVVEVALIHDGAKDHNGENLQGREQV